MALLNKTTFSIKDAEGDYVVLPSMVEVPDLGVDPEGVQTTTLDDLNHTEEDGIGDPGRLVFLFRYRPGATEAYALAEDFLGKDDLTIKVEFAAGVTVEFPSAGINLKILGGGVNDVLNFELGTGIAGAFVIATT